MLKKFLMPLAIILSGSAVIAVLVVAKPKPTAGIPPAEAKAMQVSVTPAQRLTTRLAVTTQGTVYPKREIDLVAQVAGQIVKVSEPFSEGGFFQSQQSLLQIDPRDYDVALLNAKARKADAERRLAEEQGQAKQAKREWRDLGNQQSNDLFMRKPQLAAAQANLAFAEGDLAKAELDLARTQIQVPFTGRVKQVFADLGQYVAPGAPLARVYDSSIFEVRVPLTEAQAALIDLPIQELKEGVVPPTVIVRGTVAGQEYLWQGHLVRTDAFVDPDTRMYHAVVEVAYKDNEAVHGALLPGLFVDVEISGRELADVIKLPRRALFQRDRLISVGPDKLTKSHQVKVLQKDKDFVWAHANLADGTLVTLDKQGLLTDGTEVAPITVAPALEELSKVETNEKREP